jgi:hypothetical protein
VKPSLILVAAALVAAFAVGGAGANGSPYSPGLVYGWSGVEARNSGVHFVAFGMPKSTIVAAVRARDGHVLRSAVVRGFYGVPLVTYDGTSGGLSGDGRWLVLSSYGPNPGGKGKTNFVVLRTKSFEPRLRMALPGSWSFDAVSPDAAKLYLTQHISAGDNPRYRVRSYDVDARRLRGPLVDRLEKEGEMGGQPVARASSRDGRWAYTLYARRKDVPFVHALDTARRQAYCIGLPVRVNYNRQWGLKLRLTGSSLVVHQPQGRTSLATIDVESWKVEKG